jgi:hypothetical protein
MLVIDVGPADIVKQLNLLRPIYSKTTNYGPFGKIDDPDITWEQTNKAEKSCPVPAEPGHALFHRNKATISQKPRSDPARLFYGHGGGRKKIIAKRFTFDRCGLKNAP